MRRILHIIGTALFYAVLMVTASSGAKAQVANPANLNVLLCNGPVGSIAVRYADRWRCLAPGAAGQLYQSNGPAAVGGWFTPTGTGNVTTDGNATSGQFPYFTNGTALAYMSPGGPLLDKVLGQSGSTVGYLKRTGAGAYSIATIPSSDLPALGGTDCSLASGAGSISCVGMLSVTHTWNAAQNFVGTLSVSNPSPVVTSGLVAEVNGQLLDIGVNYSQFGGANTAYNGGFVRIDTRGGGNPLFGWFSTVGTGMQTLVASTDIAGNYWGKSLTVTSPVGVASGGTGASTGQAGLENLFGFGSTMSYGNFISRNGVGVFGANTVSQILDNVNNGATVPQGSILYRDAGSTFAAGQIWKVLAPGASGQFLAANGGGANPSWASPAAPPAGNRVLINTITASNSATLTDTTSLTSTYSEYEIDFENVFPATTGAFGSMLEYIGGTLQTSGYNVVLSTTNTNAGPSRVSNTASANIPLDDANNGAATTAAFSNASGINARMVLSSPSVSKVTMLAVTSDYWGNSNGDITVRGHAAFPTAGTVTGFQFKFSTGNVASGKIKVYGWN